MEVQSPFQISWDKTFYSTFAEYIFSKITAHGSNLAIIDTDTNKQWRFSEIRLWSEMCASRLVEIGVHPQSRVAVVTGTTGQAIFVQLACSIIGCTAIAINGWSTIDEISQLADLSEATHCIAEQQFMQKAEEVRRKALMRGGSRIKQVRSIDDVLASDPLCDTVYSAMKKERRSASIVPSLGRQSSKNQILPQPPAPSSDDCNEAESSIEELLNCDSKNDLERRYSEAEPEPKVSLQPYMIFFTSGTTGLPKPVEVSRRSLMINIQQISCPLFGALQVKERFLLPLAISHIFGTISAYYALVNGASIYTVNKFNIGQVLQVIAETKITSMHVTPPMLQAFAYDERADATTFHTVRSVLVGGAPLDTNIASMCKKKMNLKDLRQTYGMTELGGICTLSHAECGRLESVGTPLPGMLFKILHLETKQVTLPHQIGQLCILGPQVTPSYYKNAKATNEILSNEGFVKTGDAAFYDENGYIYILDRIRDIIKHKGTLICPSEVELVLRAHPGIDDCAVVGRQDHVSGEVPAAFVVKSNSHPMLASAEVRQYVSGKISSFKELRGGVFFVSEIPRSACGKILRRQLRQFWDRERTATKAELHQMKESLSNDKLNSKATRPGTGLSGSRPSITPKTANATKNTPTRKVVRKKV